MMKRRNTLFLAVFAIAGAFGCQAILGIDDTTFEKDAGSSSDAGSGDGASSDGNAATDSSSPSVVLSPPSVRLLPGGSADVTVTIARGGVSGDVTISANDLDAGVGIASIAIPDGQSQGTLHVTASPSAVPGAQDVAIVQASLPANNVAPLTVAIVGAPGTIDESFANGEAAFTPGDAGLGATAVAVGIQSDGQIVLGIQPGSNSGWTVVRLTQAGDLDPTFDTNAASVMPADGALEDLVIGTHDDIFVAGTSQNELTAVHLNADGTRDNSFGTNGVAKLDTVNFS
ncbi:MAG: hypothetical protein ACREJX_11225, partial [Polyangiaceae bacterium]